MTTKGRCIRIELGNGAWSDDPQYRTFFVLPDAPAGCEVVLFGPLPPGIGGMDDSRKDWKPAFQSLGVPFPNEGFALFFSQSRVLAVATGAEGLAMIKVMLE